MSRYELLNKFSLYTAVRVLSEEWFPRKFLEHNSIDEYITNILVDT